jgi:Sulfotransferase domain
MKMDFIGVGFGRSGSNWLVHCLFEHPELSIPKFNLLTELNYFPYEYEVMGLKNYLKKFKKCDPTKKVGEISTLVILKKRSAKILKKLFPGVKIIIYQRNEKARATSEYNMVKHHDVLPTKLKMLNQTALIRPWQKEFKKDLFIFDMENPNKQEELNKLFDFIGVNHFTPSKINSRLNSMYFIKEGKKQVKESRSPFLRKLINKSKVFLGKNRKLYYTIKRSFNLDYIFQVINHKI